MEAKPERIVSFLSAFLVLVLGIYMIFFMPTAVPLTPALRLIFGAVLVLYFLLRLRFLLRKTKPGRGADVIEQVHHNKGLDKQGN